MATVAPRDLYLRLGRYYDETIENVPSGQNLVAYEKSYYDYSVMAKEIEQVTRTKIGSLLANHSPYIWNSYFEYSLLRAAGFTPDSIKGQRGDIGFGTYDEAEKTYQALLADKQGSEELSVLIQSTNQITSAAASLLALYR